MSCELRCQTCLVNQGVSLAFYTQGCLPAGLSLPTDNLSVSLVCVSIGIDLFPHDFFFLSYVMFPVSYLHLLGKGRDFYGLILEIVNT